MAFETEYGYFPATPGSGIFNIYPNLAGKKINIPRRNVECLLRPLFCCFQSTG
jgi:hypothetical protein